MENLTWTERFRRMMAETGLSIEEIEMVTGFQNVAAVAVNEPFTEWLRLAIYVHECGRHYDEHHFEDKRPRPVDQETVLIKKWNYPQLLKAVYLEEEDLFMIDVSDKHPNGKDQIFGHQIEQWKYPSS